MGSLLLAGAMLLAVPDARADAQSKWRAAAQPDGGASAEIYSVNSLSTGSRALEYHPTLSLSCAPRRYPVWRQTVLTLESVTGSGSIDVATRLDGAAPFSETWTLGKSNRTFYLEGAQTLERLMRARRVRFDWRIGLFAGSGQAIFDLDGIGDAVAKLAGMCGVDLP